MTYCFRGNGLSSLDVVSSASGSSHLLSILTTDSANLIPGEYSVAGYAIVTGKRIQVWRGKIIVTVNLQTLDPGADTRTQARRTLDAVELVIEGRASSSILNSIVDGTTLNRLMPEQLLKLRDRYKTIVLKEEAAEMAAQGRSSTNNIFTRFTFPR